MGALFEWDPGSTYVREPPFFVDMPAEAEPPQDIEGARALALLGDSITTDHISPAGSIAGSSPAASTCEAMASSRASSTRTAPGAATTR